MTNQDIIQEFIETTGIDFEYNGQNLCTFQQWKSLGFSVKKGEKAEIKLPLWTMKLEEEKDENGKVIKDKKGKPKKVKKFYKKTSALFFPSQVEKAEKKAPKKKGKAVA